MAVRCGAVRLLWKVNRFERRGGEDEASLLVGGVTSLYVVGVWALEPLLRCGNSGVL